MVECDFETRTLWLYGECFDKKTESEDGFSDSEVIQALNKLGDAAPVTVRLNSPGGSYTAGMAIYNALKRMESTVTTINDSTAASIASIIFCAGDVRLVAEFSHMLLHPPHTLTAGNKKELRHTADLLQTYENTMADLYMSCMPDTDRDDLLAIMDAETWLTAREAFDCGLANGIDGHPEARVSAKRDLKMAAFGVNQPSPQDVEASRQRLAKSRKMTKHQRHVAQTSIWGGVEHSWSRHCERHGIAACSIQSESQQAMKRKCVEIASGLRQRDYNEWLAKAKRRQNIISFRLALAAAKASPDWDE